VLRGDWVPVIVQIPLDWKHDRFSLELDGEPFEDPLTTVRRRKGNAREPGAQLLATLPLTGLEPGEHELVVRIERDGAIDRTLSSRFQTKPRRHTVSLRLHDGHGYPVNGRVVVRRDGEPVQLTDRSGWRSERKHRNRQLDAVYVRDGEGSVRLDPGSYKLVATRGLRDAVNVVELELDGDRELNLAVPRLVESPGLTMDPHLHTGSSYDAYVPHAVRLHSLACSGIDAVVVTEHNRIAKPARLEDQLAGKAPVPWLIPGVEGDLRARVGKNWDWGHLTAWPLVAGAAPPSRWPKTPAHAVAAWRRWQGEHPHPETGDDLLLTLAHPRGIQFRTGGRSKDQAWALFNNFGYDRSFDVGFGDNAWMLERAGEGGPTVMDFDALEVVNRMGLEKYREVRQDWFALLNQGYLMAGVGGSDSHALAVELPGLPQTVVHGADDSSLTALVDATRAGRVSVTTGPYLELTLEGHGQQAGLGETLSVPDGELVAHIVVRHAPWVPVHELRLVVNGHVLHRSELGGRTRNVGPAVVVRETVPISSDRDLWVLVEAGWPEAAEDSLVGGTYSVVAPGYVPFAFTNPVYVDADGDGAWTPPSTQWTPESAHGP